jgi:Nitrite and sulphite reductase 4Fe-4S domain
MLVFRDHGSRGDRQKTRLIWLVEELGNEEFTRLVSERIGGAEFMPHVDPGYTDVWKRRDILGVHPQAQEGLSWVRTNDSRSSSLRIDQLLVRWLDAAPRLTSCCVRGNGLATTELRRLRCTGG